MENKEEDLISIVVPIYKVEDYLRRCIDSIIGQTYKNLEIILVDDGSPDKCPQICDEYEKKDNRIKVIHKKNGGLSSARNTGLDIILGKYVTFIDSDDFLDVNAIKEWKKIYDDNEADMVVGNYNMYYGQDVITADQSKQGEIFSAEEMLRKILVEDSRLCVAWGKLYDARLFEEIRYPEDVKFAEDMAVIHKILLKCNKVVYDANKRYFYSQEGISLVRSSFTMQKLTRIDIAKEWLECVDLHYPNIHNEAFANYMTILINECTYLLEDLQWKKYLEEYINVIRAEYCAVMKNSYIRSADKVKAFLLKNRLVGVYKIIRKVCIKEKNR